MTRFLDVPATARLIARTGVTRVLRELVDTLRADGADQLITWVADGDEARIRFLSGAGLSPDGAVRELASGPGPDGDETVLREHRWGALI